MHVLGVQRTPFVISYVRSVVSAPRPRKLEPLGVSHPAVGEMCIACSHRFVAGDVTCCVPLGPGDDPVEQELARAGATFNAFALVVHWSCATGEQP